MYTRGWLFCLIKSGEKDAFLSPWLATSKQCSTEKMLRGGEGEDDDEEEGETKREGREGEAEEEKEAH